MEFVGRHATEAEKKNMLNPFFPTTHSIIQQPAELWSAFAKKRDFWFIHSAYIDAPGSRLALEVISYEMTSNHGEEWTPDPIRPYIETGAEVIFGDARHSDVFSAAVASLGCNESNKA